MKFLCSKVWLYYSVPKSWLSRLHMPYLPRYRAYVRTVQTQAGQKSVKSVLGRQRGLQFWDESGFEESRPTRSLRHVMVVVTAYSVATWHRAMPSDDMSSVDTFYSKVGDWRWFTSSVVTKPVDTAHSILVKTGCKMFSRSEVYADIFFFVLRCIDPEILRFKLGRQLILKVTVCHLTPDTSIVVVVVVVVGHTYADTHTYIHTFLGLPSLSPPLPPFPKEGEGDRVGRGLRAQKKCRRKRLRRRGTNCCLLDQNSVQ